MKLSQSWLVLRHDITCDGILGSYKGTPAHNRVSFFALQQALCVIVCLIWCCLSQAIYIILASGHTSAVCSLFGSAARPSSSRGSCLCGLWSTADQSAALRLGCVWCGQARAPRDSGPASAEAAWWLRSWGSQMYLLRELETAAAHSQSSSDSSDHLTPRVEARIEASSAREEDPMFELSDSEELDVLSIEAGEIAESSPLHSHVHEELVDVLTPAVAKLNINWPQEGRKCKWALPAAQVSASTWG